MSNREKKFHGSSCLWLEFMSALFVIDIFLVDYRMSVICHFSLLLLLTILTAAVRLFNHSVSNEASIFNFKKCKAISSYQLSTLIWLPLRLCTIDNARGNCRGKRSNCNLVLEFGPPIKWKGWTLSSSFSESFRISETNGLQM